jgi:hypothetical protein
VAERGGIVQNRCESRITGVNLGFSWETDADVEMTLCEGQIGKSMGDDLWTQPVEGGNAHAPRLFLLSCLNRAVNQEHREK